MRALAMCCLDTKYSYSYFTNEISSTIGAKWDRYFVILQNYHI